MTGEVTLFTMKGNFKCTDCHNNRGGYSIFWGNEDLKCTDGHNNKGVYSIYQERMTSSVLTVTITGEVTPFIRKASVLMVTVTKVTLFSEEWKTSSVLTVSVTIMWVYSIYQERKTSSLLTVTLTAEVIPFNMERRPQVFSVMWLQGTEDRGTLSLYVYLTCSPTNCFVQSSRCLRVETQFNGPWWLVDNTCIFGFCMDHWQIYVLLNVWI